jgi:hypothetical protein
MRQNGTEGGGGDDGDDGENDESNVGVDDDKIAVPVERQRPAYKADTLLLLS